MVFFDTKQLRVYARLWIFCLVFGVLSGAFGILFAAEQRELAAYRQSDEMLAYAGLCEYLSQCGELLAETENASPASLVMLSRRFASLSGGARTLLVSLPTGRVQRERLTAYFSSADEYLYSLSVKLLTGELPNDGDSEIISALRSYAALTVGRLERFSNQSYPEIAEELAVLAIDTPPKFSEIAPSNSPENEAASAKGCSPLLNISNGQAKSIAMRYLGRYSNLRRAEPGKGVIRFYNGSSFIDILRGGGVVTRISIGREITRLCISGDEARSRANAHLAAMRVSDAKPIAENVVGGRMDFRYYLNGAYITIGVALDNGKIVRYDASRYFNKG